MAKQYEVFARKWRPQQFEELVGQDHVVTTLRNAIENDRLAHAYLFVGPRGTGKTSTARIFAKALNCKKGPTVSPCHDKDRKSWCANCQEIADGRSLDVLEIDGASNNGVEQVRELRDTVRYAPANAKYKIFIIDEVHMLSTAAFNALLKTLEEPPAHVKFLFATTEPQKVLATILSRCQRFDLRRIPSGLIADHLKKIAAKENVSIDDKAIAAISRGAEGGLRDAESALDQLVSFCQGKISEEDVLSVFGLVAHEQMAGLSDAIIDSNTNNALCILKSLDDGGKDLQRLLTDMLDHFRNLLVMTLGSQAAVSLDVPETELALLNAQKDRIDSDAVLRIIDELAGVEGRLRYALSKRVILEIALVKAIKTRGMVGLDGILRKLNELKQQVAAGDASMSVAPVNTPSAVPPARATNPSPVNRPASPSPVATPKPASAVPSSAPRSEPSAAPRPGLSASIAEAWRHAAEHLGRVNPLAKTYIASAHPVELRGQVLVVGFDPEFPERREFIDRARNIQLLQDGLREKLHMDVSLKFELLDGPMAATMAKSASQEGTTPSSASAQADDFKSDPLIRKALEIFKAQIVDVRQ
jgi:DNA polymerase-3 subunit gamma/tau